MLRGFIDVLSGNNRIHGWAVETRDSLNPRTVAIYGQDDEVVSIGIASHYREDLVNAQCGAGWSGFSLRTNIPANQLLGRRLRLVDYSTAKLLHTAQIGRIDNLERTELKSLDEVVSSDPTVLTSVNQLRGCQELFQQFVRTNGVEKFVRLAYAYVLSRPVDFNGLRTYSDAIKLGSLTPAALLEVLARSEEFKAAPRRLPAPTTSSFPFRLT